MLRRVVLAVLASLLGLSALGIAGAELYLRSTIHPPPEADFPFAQPPLAELEVVVSQDLPGLGARKVRFRSNALGLRGRDLDLEDHSALRILTLGDSVTECLLLAAEDSWPERLGAELERRLGRPVWVGNAAKSGEMVPDYEAHMRLLVPRLEPDLVIVLPGGHDFQAALEESLLPVDLSDPARLSAYAKKLYSDQNLAALSPSYLRFMLERGDTVETLDITDFYARMRQRRSAAPKLAELPALEDPLDIYRSSLDALFEAHRKLGQSQRANPVRTKLLMVTQPSIWHEGLPAVAEAALWGGYTCMDCDDPRYYDQRALAVGIRAFNDVLVASAAQRGVPVLELDRLLDKSLGNFYDDAHMGEQGAKRTASVLADFIVEKGLLR